MGHLMESSSGLILSVACLRKCWKVAVVDWAVDDNVRAWQGICKNVALAVSVDVSAVVFGGAGADGGALTSNSRETSGNGVAH